MIAALLGLDATGWAVLAGLVALFVIVALAVSVAAGLFLGRVIRLRDRQVPHTDLRTHLICLYGLDPDECSDDRIVLAAMEHLEHDRTD